MHPYILLLGGACVVSALSAGFVLGNRPRDHRASRLAVGIFAGSAYWALCEVLWNLSPDADRALRLVRASAPGWCFVGPLVMHLFLEATRVPWVRLWKTLPWFYASSCGFLLVTWFTPWMFTGVVKTGWGWGYVTGPAYPLWYATVMACVVPAIAGMAHAFRITYSPAERRQRPWILLGIGAPLLVGSLTDALLPALGIQLPRLATTTFAALGGVATFSLWHLGYSFLTPSGFADEIFDTLSEGVALLQWNKQIRTANGGLARLSGRPRAELEGMAIDDLLTVRSDANLDDEQVDGELHRADGELIPVKLSSSALSDRRGHPIGSVIIVRDVREVADLRQQLLLSARLAAVGELAAGIAHEINNPLAFIRANLTHLQSLLKQARGALAGQPEVLDALAEGDELIEESVLGTDRAAEIVRGVRGFSHAGGGPRELADLNRLVEEVLRMADTHLRGRARVELDLGSLPLLSCAPQEIRQVLLNLMINASHAIEDGGTIRIETRSRERQVSIAVQDDGCGIAPEIIDRIFDPFFTTKKVGEGTGLGLGIAYQIVRGHGGEISVQSRPRQGARFEVRLPLGSDGDGP